MLFMAYEDRVDLVRAYCVPDGYGETANLIVMAHGERIATLSPNAFNEHMKGRHKTGFVDFIIDTQTIEDLARLDDLELRDEATGMLVYRRPLKPSQVDQAVFRLETRFLPFWKFDKHLEGKFRFWYDRIDSYSIETVKNILSLHCFTSLYSSGRILIDNYKFYLDNHQKCVFCMYDPYQDLAERIMILRRLDNARLSQLIGERDSLIFEAVSNALKEYSSPLDEKTLKAAFRRLTREELVVLSNPVCRQLTSSTPDEIPRPNIVTRALQEASMFEIVGIGSQEGDYLEAVAELLGTDVVEPRPVHPEIVRMTEILKTIPVIETILESDLLLFDHIQTAFSSVGGHSS